MVLTSLIGYGALEYIYDIIIRSPIFQQHLADLKKFFNGLQREKLKIKLSKREYCKSSLIYLGHRISRKGIEPDQAKAEAVERALPPTNLTEF